MCLLQIRFTDILYCHVCMSRHCSMWQGGAAGHDGRWDTLLSRESSVAMRPQLWRRCGGGRGAAHAWFCKRHGCHGGYARERQRWWGRGRQRGPSRERRGRLVLVVCYHVVDQWTAGRGTASPLWAMPLSGRVCLATCGGRARKRVICHAVNNCHMPVLKFMKIGSICDGRWTIGSRGGWAQRGSSRMAPAEDGHRRAAAAWCPRACANNQTLPKADWERRRVGAPSLQISPRAPGSGQLTTSVLAPFATRSDASGSGDGLGDGQSAEECGGDW